MIRATALELTYPETDHPALSGVDLDLAPSEVLGVVGPMGAGKTSLCMSLAGLVPRTSGGEASGTLEVDGRDPREAPVPEVARRIGLVFEDYASQLTQVTVLGEVTAPLLNRGTPLDEAQDTARKLLAELGLGHLDPDHKRTWELSGGQQQRVAVAAALAGEPQVLILDNITGLLDPDGKEEIRHLIRELSSRMTLVVVEQDVDLLVGIADQLLVLQDGQVRAHGPATQLLRDVDLLASAQVEPPTVVQVARAAGLHGAPLTVEDLARACQRLAVSVPELSHAAGTTPSSVARPGTRWSVNVDHVSFTYPDGTAAVRHVLLQVAAGEVHAVVGGNGAGKSTLLRMLCGLVRPHSGAIIIDGNNTAKISPADLARVVGTALQNPDEQITERTVRAEIAHPMTLRRFRRSGWRRREVVYTDEQIADAVERARTLVGLPEELMDADPSHLSRGHRKVVAIAGALVLDPAVLILDEPRVSLDAPARAALRQLLHRLRDRGTAVIIVEHDLDLVAETADTVTLLDRGRVVSAGSPREVFGSRGAQELAGTSLRPPRAAQVAAHLGVEAYTVAELAAQLEPVPQEA